MSVDRFFTDPKLADRIIRWIGIEPGMRVLEPSAGSGSFVSPLVFAGARVTAVELDPDLYRGLSKMVFDSGPGLVGEWKHFPGDFLDFKPNPDGSFPFDLVVMNPPYGSRTRGDSGLAHVHVRHALKFAPRVVALVASGFEFGKRAHGLFETARMNRRVVIEQRPEFHGPDDKGESPRRDHVVLELGHRTDQDLDNPRHLVETERW